MAKRISVKGKGADIFFGDYPPTPPTATPLSDSPGNKTAAPSNAVESTVEVSTQQSLQESKKARTRARKQDATAPEGIPESPLAVDIINSVWQYVSKQATVTNAFRYTEQELSGLTDAVYEVNKRHGIKLTKQDLARLGLNIVLWDYRLRGDTSLLGEFAAKKKRQQE